MTARFYFSLRSPYSWLAHLDLTRLYPDVAESVQWRPFWEPDEDLLGRLTESFPYVDMSRAKSLYILQDVRRLARRRGLEVTWPVDRVPRWEVAHLGYLVAERAGAGRAFLAAVYRARWQLGHNISDPEVIAAIGAEIGVDAEALRCAADDPDLRKEGLEALRALVRDGVFGVPFFVCGREKFWGIDRLADFAAMVREKSGGQNADDVTLVPQPALAADQGHAGGCG